MKFFILFLNIFIFFFHLESHASYRCFTDQKNGQIYLENDSTESESVQNLSENDRLELNKFTDFLIERIPSHFHLYTRNWVTQQIVFYLNINHKISLTDADELLKNTIKETMWKGVRGSIILSILTLWTYGAYELTSVVPIYFQPVILPVSLVTSIGLLNAYTGAHINKLYQLINHIGKVKNPIPNTTSFSLNTLFSKTSETYDSSQIQARKALTLACDSIELQLNGLNTDLQILSQTERRPFLLKRLSEIVFKFQECFQDVGPFRLAIREPVKTRLSIYKNFLTSNSIDEILELIPAEYRTEDQLNAYREILEAWLPAAQAILNEADPSIMESVVIHTE